MKKILTYILAATMLISLSGCKKDNIITEVLKPTTPIENKYSSELTKAKDYILRKDFKAAIEILDKIDDEAAKELRKQTFEQFKSQALIDANQLILKYDYKGAANLLTPIKELMLDEDQNLIKLYDTCIKYSNLVPYEGVVEHIFFHPLMAYPELAFDGDSMQQGFDNFMVTVGEFKRTMEAFHKASYILIDIRTLYTVNPDGTVTQNKLMLPEGKKPLVLSLDDYNFLKYMRQNGCVSGLALDKNNKVVTFTNKADGTVTYSDDNEVVPIMDKYILENPDFSFGGAKGVIGLNGYEGALGYPTDELDSPKYTENLTKARAVADKLKETGWSFACHSYSHYRPGKRTFGQMKYDTDKWIMEVGAVVGPTDVYIYPFGEQIPKDDPKFQYMLQSGFKMFCGVQQQPLLTNRTSFILQMRRNIDGISLQGKYLPKIIDTSKIPDPIRPWYNDFMNKQQ